MSASLSFQTIISGNISGGGSKTETNDSIEIAAPSSVPAALSATLTTRVSATAGTLTMASSSHGIITGQRLDFYWEGGSCFGVTAGTVSGTSIPFTIVQGGDALPTALTTILVSKCVSVSFRLTGDYVSAMMCGRAGAAVRCRYTFLETLGILALTVLNQSGAVFVWDGTTTLTGPVGSGTGNFPGGRNPLANCNPIEVYISHANTAAADTTLMTAALKE